MIDFSKLPTTAAIVGSRSIAYLSPNSRPQQDIKRFISKLNPYTLIVSGGAVGVDLFAENLAKEHMVYDAAVYIPDEQIPSPARYFARNSEIVNHVKDDQGFVVGFVDVTRCRGTYDTLRKAARANLPVVCFCYSPKGQYLHYNANSLFQKYLTERNT